MEISLNGNKVNVHNTTLFDLIRDTGFDDQSLIAELNFEIIPQDDWKNTAIKAGDQIELLSFVGGG